MSAFARLERIMLKPCNCHWSDIGLTLDRNLHSTSRGVFGWRTSQLKGLGIAATEAKSDNRFNFAAIFCARDIKSQSDHKDVQ